MRGKILEAREVGNLDSEKLFDIVNQERMSPAKELLISLDKFSAEEIIERKIELYKKYINKNDDNYYHEFELDEYFITKDYCDNKEKYHTMFDIRK